MRFVSVRGLRGNSAQVWRQLADEKEMVITSNGKPVAILSAVSEATVEQSLSTIRRARAMAAVASLQQRSAAQGTDGLTARDIDAEIAVVRRKRRR